MNAAHCGVHSSRLHQRYATVDVSLRHLGELAVVDGDIALAASRVGGARRTWDSTFDLLQHFLHTGEVDCASSRILLVELLKSALGSLDQCNGTVLRHDGVHGPCQCERLTPTDGAACDGDDTEIMVREVMESSQGLFCYGAFRCQRIVDVCENANYAGVFRP